MERVRQESPEAADLLNLCAFLAPEDIPRDILRKEYLLKSLASMTAGELTMNRAIAPLRRYSLIEASADSISVHRLVQMVVRDRLDEGARRTWAKAALRLMNGAFPHDSHDPHTWPVCKLLLPHALAAAKHAEDLGVVQEVGARSLNQAGLYLRGRTQLAEARAALERGLAIDEKKYGKNHTSVATIANNLGSVLRDMGELQGAKERFERALEIDEKAYGKDHTSVARDVNNLGLVLKDMGDLQGAEACFERALRITQKRLGNDHPHTILVQNNLESLRRR